MLIQTLIKNIGNVARPALPTEAPDQVCLQELWVYGGGSPTEALTLFFKSCLRGHFSLETIRNKRMWGGSTAPRLSFMSVSFLYIPSCPSVCITPFVPPPFLFAFKFMKLCCGSCLPFFLFLLVVYG